MVNINTSKFSKVLAKFYTDTFEVHRYQQVIDGDGATVDELSPVPFLTGIACRISFDSDDDPNNMDNGANKKYQTISIFTEPYIDVKKGDYIKAFRTDNDGVVRMVYSGWANLPNFYDNHTKFTFTEKGEA